MALQLLSKIFGSKNERQLKRMGRLVDQIATYEEDFGKLSDADLAGQREVFRARLEAGENASCPSCASSAWTDGFQSVGRR